MLRRLRIKKRGFTFVEILVTLAIVAILAAAALPLAQIAVKRQKEIELQRNLRMIREAIDLYKQMADEKKITVEDETEGYPSDLEILVQGVEVKETTEGEEKVTIHKFLRRIPKDPMTKSTEWGLRSYQDSPDTNVWGGENVYDVYTKSPGIALDGSRYRDW